MPLLLALALVACKANTTGEACASNSVYRLESQADNLSIFFDFENRYSGWTEKGSEAIYSQQGKPINKCSGENFSCIDGVFPLSFGQDREASNWETPYLFCTVEFFGESEKQTCRNIEGQTVYRYAWEGSELVKVYIANDVGFDVYTPVKCNITQKAIRQFLEKKN